MEGPQNPVGASPKLILDGALHAGLRAAFACVADDRLDESALDAVELRSGAPARVMLRDPLDASGTVVEPTPAAERSRRDMGRRYEVHGELAKGGIGVILKGRDTELGRVVAIKILRNRYANDPDMLRRFVAEAQIGGQLQHPGILPVYDIGVRPDGKPFFTMKLIQGQTLAALLETRTKPGEDRAHMLSILVQVCQTVAYAHACGVVHRDLKPSNIMIGAFGEVQVLDWGLSKILASGGVVDDRRSGANGAGGVQVRATDRLDLGRQSQSGSVMGTPAYMPPEQARGEVDRLDERSDVFSLGAILCEVLTGKPPYVGSTQQSMRHQAAQAELAPALVRLAESGADAELVRISSAAMEPEQRARPRDAGVVAEELSAFMASVDEQLRKAELAQAAAEARAQSEGRARKLTVALAGIVLLITLVGGGGYMFLNQQRQTRLANTSRAVEQAMGKAKLHEGQALATIGDALPSWDLALEAVRRAQAAATAGESDSATRAELTGMLTAFMSAREAAEEDQARVLADRDVLARLGHIRDAGLTDHDYANAFRKYGIDIDALSSGEAANAIRATAIGLELTGFLDPWATTRMHERNDKSQDWGRLLDIALLADGDEWRSRMREAVRERDRSALLDLARTAPVDELPAVTLQLMGEALANVQQYATAVELLQPAQRRFPQDFRINRALAGSLARLSPPRWQAVVQYRSAALSSRPDSLKARVDLSIATRKAGDPAVARSWLDSALAMGKHVDKHVDIYLYLSVMLTELGELDLGLEAIQNALSVDSENSSAWYNKGKILNLKGDLEGSLEAFQKALELDPRPKHYNNVGAGLTFLGRREEARAMYRKGIDANPNDYLLHYNMGARLGTAGELSDALRELNRSRELNPFLPQTHYRMGLVLEQLDRWPEAVQAYREAIRLQGSEENDFIQFCYNSIGIWHYDQGELEEAESNFRMTIEICEAAFFKPGNLYDEENALATGYFNLGNTQRKGGMLRKALASYRTSVQVQPTYWRAFIALGHLLRGENEVEEALVAYRAAHALQRENVEAMDALGWGLIRNSRYLEAIPYLRLVWADQPDDARLGNNLAYALEMSGAFGEAREIYQQLLEAHGDDPEVHEEFSAFIEECSRMLELATRLPHVVSGTQTPANALEAVEFAKVAARKRLRKASSQLWLSAFDADPELAKDALAENLYHAACSLAMAGCQLGKDADAIDSEIATSWRGQALRWLSPQLEHWRRQLASSEQAERDEAVEKLKHWKYDRCLVGVRDEAHLEKLPEAEQAEWRTFWAEVLELLEQGAK